MANAITEARVRALRKGQVLMCGKISGFGVRRSPKRGTVAFFVRRVVDGRDIRETIGKHEDMSVREARCVARTRLGELVALARVQTRRRPAVRSVARVEAPDRENRSTREAPDRADRDQELHAMMRELLAHVRPVERPTCTINEIADVFRQESYPDLKQATRDGYDISIDKDILPVFGGMKVTAIDAAKIEAYHRSFKGKAESQGKKSTAMLLRLLRLAKQKKFLEAVPEPKIKQYRQKQTSGKGLAERQVHRLSAQLERLLETDPSPYTLAMIFLLNTGERRQACVSLRVEDVDFERKVIRRKRKFDKVEAIPISDYAAAFLKSILPQARGGWFFPKPRGTGHISGEYLRVKLRTLCVENKVLLPNGQPPCLHSLRHTWASVLEMQGIPLSTIQRLLGHSSIKTTLKYVHGDASKSREACNLASAVTAVGLGSGPNNRSRSG